MGEETERIREGRWRGVAVLLRDYMYAHVAAGVAYAKEVRVVMQDTLGRGNKRGVELVDEIEKVGGRGGGGVCIIRL